MEKVIYFPRGLAGFEGLHEFTLLQIRPDAPMLLLQSMDKPLVGLLVADPFSFMDDYRIKVSDAEQKLLRLKNVRQVAVLVTVSIPAGKPEETALNLTGPILINHQARIGLQIPQSEGQSPTQIRLHGLTARAGKAQMDEQATQEQGGTATEAKPEAANMQSEVLPKAQSEASPVLRATSEAPATKVRTRVKK